MGTPVVYRTASPLIASFDFNDLATGKAYKTFYGIRTSGGYALTTETTGSGYISGIVTSNNVEGILTAGTANVDALTIVANLNFTATFDIPQVMEGEAIVGVSVGGDSLGDATTKHYKVVANVYNGTTFIASGATAIIAGKTNGAAGEEESYQFAILVDLPETRLSKGDVLKLNTEYWHRKTAADPGTTRWAIAHDPAGRTDPNTGLPYIKSTESTILNFRVPFKIQE